MATTTNYSWVTPEDTDLVKDGAAAIRTLGSSADTTVKNLNPGTTAGDIDYYTSSTAKARIAIGTAGQILTVNAGATAPEWAALAGGGWTLITSGSLSSTTTTVSSISGAYTDLKILFYDMTSSTSTADIYMTYNNTDTIYNPGATNTGITDTWEAVNAASTNNLIANNVNTNGANNFGVLIMYNYSDTGYWKFADFRVWQRRAVEYFHWGWYSQRIGLTGAINRFDITATSGNLSGTYEVYGM